MFHIKIEHTLTLFAYIVNTDFDIFLKGEYIILTFNTQTILFLKARNT